MAEEQKLTFEQSIEQLEQILDEIEAGEVGLDELLRYYERGVKLHQHCSKILDAAKQRIGELTVDETGQLQAEGDAEPTLEQ